MQRLSTIINDIYNKFLPLAERTNVQLDLDFADPTQEVSDPEELKREVEFQLKAILDTADEGNISLAVKNDAIVITDSGTILSPTFAGLLTTERVSVKSRVGFGTTVTISFKRATSNESAPAKLKSGEPAKLPATAKKTTKKSTTKAPKAKKTKKLFQKSKQKSQK